MIIDRRNFIAKSAMAVGASTMPSLAGAVQQEYKYEVGAYYFPCWHPDPRRDAVHGKDWTEWQLLRHAGPRFPGHQQPKVPLWGYENESIPSVFEKKIDAAANNGVTYFIFDWYWYEGKPFLNAGLDKGYLGSANNNRVKFCLMWANHDWINLFPAKLNAPRWLQYKGAVNRHQFDIVTGHIISNYFSHPSYFKIDECPYISVYEISHLIAGLGGVAAAQAALQSFRQKTQAAGHKDLHLNVVQWGIQPLPAFNVVDLPRMLKDISCQSTASYCWAHGPMPTSFPSYDYEDAMRLAVQYWTKASTDFPLPFYPNVSMGWDPSPRACQSDIYTQSQYPFTSVMTGNTPERFKQALKAAKVFVDRKGGSPRVLNINAWNEWTEGSYLEPDTLNKMDYLNAIKEVFSPS